MVLLLVIAPCVMGGDSGARFVRGWDVDDGEFVEGDEVEFVEGDEVEFVDPGFSRWA